MKKITTHINVEELKVLSGFLLNDNEVLISDAEKLGDFKKVRLVIEPSYVKFLVEECDFLEDCDIEYTVF